MLKKIFYILGILLLGLILYYKFDRYNLRQKFLTETIGSNRIKQVKLLDEWNKDDFAGDGFLQVYIYEIKNKQKLKCDSFSDYDFVDNLNFYEIEKKYLNMKKSNNCQRTKITKDVTSTVIIQNNILIIRRIGSSIPKKSYEEFKQYIDSNKR